MDHFFESNPGMSSRIAHHLDFADYNQDELLAIGQLMLDRSSYLSVRRGHRRAAGLPVGPDAPAKVRQCPQRKKRAGSCPAAACLPAGR
jgi:hypothetical protein